MPIAFSGVLLDMDGLLLDTERLELEAGPAVLAAMGYHLPAEFFMTTIGVDRLKAIKMIEAEIGEPLDASALNAALDRALKDLVEHGVPLRPGAVAFLDALDEVKIPRAIATNSMTVQAEWKLERAGLRDRFDAIVGVDQVVQGKPAPDVYLEAAHRLGLAPSQCVALDDSDLGVQAAVAAGVMTVIQVPDLLPSVELKAHHQAMDLAEARVILQF